MPQDPSSHCAFCGHCLGPPIENKEPLPSAPGSATGLVYHQVKLQSAFAFTVESTRMRGACGLRGKRRGSLRRS